MKGSRLRKNKVAAAKVAFTHKNKMLLVQEVKNATSAEVKIYDKNNRFVDTYKFPQDDELKVISIEAGFRLELANVKTGTYVEQAHEHGKPTKLRFQRKTGDYNRYALYDDQNRFLGIRLTKPAYALQSTNKQTDGSLLIKENFVEAYECCTKCTEARVAKKPCGCGSKK